jgi:aldehyde dehydrogenase (NAD+)
MPGDAVAIADGIARDIVCGMGRTETEAQRAWAARPVRDRLAVLKQARRLLARRTAELCAAISPELARSSADTRVAEVLPLLAAGEYLEREAEEILAARRVGRHGRPFWLAGVTSEIQRVPMGRVLVIAPANYPLFLPGVQVLQALAAGNSVVWKPGRGGLAVALVFAEAMREAGLPEGLLEATEESVAAAEAAMSRGVDKVFFTGSAEAGRLVMRRLAETSTPLVAELSGCDAVFVLASADLGRVVKALAFGMRLNGSATCMAPRRVILVGADRSRRDSFLGWLRAALDSVAGVRIAAPVREELRWLMTDATAAGASVHGELEELQRPVVVTGVRPEMRIAQADIFAPVLSVMEARDVEEALVMQDQCRFALTASVFGDEGAARRLAARVTAGTVTINDLMVPTADPRVPFGGRKGSGFGATRGAEGLLEMTAAKVVMVRRGGGTRQYEATTESHEGLFDGVIGMSHGGTWRERWRGLREMVKAARGFGDRQ